MDIIKVIQNQLDYLIAFGIVTLIDFLTGVSGAILNRAFCSNKLRSGIDKYIKYSAFCLLGCVLEFALNQSIARWCIIIPIAIESISIIENVGKASGYNVFNKVKDIINDAVGIDLDPDEDSEQE